MGAPRVPRRRRHFDLDWSERRFDVPVLGTDAPASGSHVTVEYSRDHPSNTRFSGTHWYSVTDLTWFPVALIAWGVSMAVVIGGRAGDHRPVPHGWNPQGEPPPLMVEPAETTGAVGEAPAVESYPRAVSLFVVVGIAIGLAWAAWFAADVTAYFLAMGRPFHLPSQIVGRLVVLLSAFVLVLAIRALRGRVVVSATTVFSRTATVTRVIPRMRIVEVGRPGASDIGCKLRLDDGRVVEVELSEPQWAELSESRGEGSRTCGSGHGSDRGRRIGWSPSRGAFWLCAVALVVGAGTVVVAHEVIALDRGRSVTTQAIALTPGKCNDDEDRCWFAARALDDVEAVLDACVCGHPEVREGDRIVVEYDPGDRDNVQLVGAARPSVTGARVVLVLASVTIGAAIVTLSHVAIVRHRALGRALRSGQDLF